MLCERLYHSESDGQKSRALPLSAPGRARRGKPVTAGALSGNELGAVILAGNVGATR